MASASIESRLNFGGDHSGIRMHSTGEMRLDRCLDHGQVNGRGLTDGRVSGTAPPATRYGAPPAPHPPDASPFTLTAHPVFLPIESLHSVAMETQLISRDLARLVKPEEYMEATVHGRHRTIHAPSPARGGW